MGGEEQYKITNYKCCIYKLKINNILKKLELYLKLLYCFMSSLLKWSRIASFTLSWTKIYFFNCFICFTSIWKIIWNISELPYSLCGPSSSLSLHLLCNIFDEKLNFNCAYFILRIPIKQVASRHTSLADRAKLADKFSAENFPYTHAYTHTHCSLSHQSGTTHEARPKIEFPTLACFSFSFFFVGRQTNFVQMKFKTLASLMKINTDLLWGGGRD